MPSFLTHNGKSLRFPQCLSEAQRHGTSLALQGPFIGFLPNPDSLPHPLPVFPGITSQINYFHPNPCLRLWHFREPKLGHYQIQSLRNMIWAIVFPHVKPIIALGRGRSLTREHRVFQALAPLIALALSPALIYHSIGFLEYLEDAIMGPDSKTLNMRYHLSRALFLMPSLPSAPS